MAPHKHRTSPPPDEKLLRLVFDSVRDYAIFSMDPDGLVTSWNRGAERLLGWTDSEIMGSSADLVFTPEDRASGVPEKERIDASSGGRALNERWQQRKDGTRFWASGLLMPLEDRSHGFVKIFRDRTEKHLANEQLRRSEQRQKMLMAELQHRTRNVVALAHAIGIRTMRRHAAPSDFEREFGGRMRALGRLQGAIFGTDDQTADLRGLVTAEIEVYLPESDRSDRASIRGPDVTLFPDGAQALGLAVHELTTNAVKHGALGQDGGRLAVVWHVEDRRGQPWVVLVWKESGVRRVAETAGPGSGRDLIERALPYQLEAETSWTFEADGIRCTIALPALAVR